MSPVLVTLQPWHFDYFLSPEEAASLSGRALGKTLIGADGTPLGFGGVYFDENGDGQCVAMAFFYGGPNGYFVRKYLPLVMRCFRDTAKTLIEMGVGIVYAIADKKIPDACRLIAWMGGELVPDAHDPSGDIYLVRLEKMTLIDR